jgi:hypothetical protein
MDLFAVFERNGWVNESSTNYSLLKQQCMTFKKNRYIVSRTNEN